MDALQHRAGRCPHGELAEADYEAYGDVHLAVQASRLGMDWRPILGVRPADAGQLIEVVLARFIAETHLEEHNEAIEAANAESKSE